MLPISTSSIKNYQFRIIFHYFSRYNCWTLIFGKPEILRMGVQAVSQNSPKLLDRLSGTRSGHTFYICCLICKAWPANFFIVNTIFMADNLELQELNVYQATCPSCRASICLYRLCWTFSSSFAFVQTGSTIDWHAWPVPPIRQRCGVYVKL